MSKMNPNDKVEAKRLALINARAKKADAKYQAVEGPRQGALYKKNRAEFDKKLAESNSVKGVQARIQKDMESRKKKSKSPIPASPTN